MKTATWMSRHWRAGLAFVYSIICIVDFIVIPSFIGLSRVESLALIDSIISLDSVTQQELIRAIYKDYQPLTLQGSGMFHLSFGALLTGAAIKGKQE